MNSLVFASQEEIPKIKVSRKDRIITRSSSKGNQLKWISGDKFIKANLLGYEGTAEVAVSWLLSFTDIDRYVEYYNCLIVEDDKPPLLGCYSYNFIPEGYDEITVGRILSLEGISFGISKEDLYDFLEEYTSNSFRDYIETILCLDAITKNEDRHFHNISLLRKGNQYISSPIFDNGSACLSDMMVYPFTANIEDNLKHVYAKPFHEDFLYQISPYAKRIGIHYQDLLNSFDSKNFGKEENRALEVIFKGLKEAEGIAWEQI